MKKTYIAPSTEIQMTQVQSIMAVSLPHRRGEDGDEADSRSNHWSSIWDKDEDEEDF